MPGAGVNGLKTSAIIGIGGIADLQFVPSFIVKKYGTFGAVDFKCDVVVAAPGIAACFYGAYRPVPETYAE